MKFVKNYIIYCAVLIVLIIIALFVLFSVKHHTDDVSKIVYQLRAERESKQYVLDVLQAELSYLTKPSRLKSLRDKYSSSTHVIRPDNVLIDSDSND